MISVVKGGQVATAMVRAEGLRFFLNWREETVAGVRLAGLGYQSEVELHTAIRTRFPGARIRDCATGQWAAYKKPTTQRRKAA